MVRRLDFCLSLKLQPHDGKNDFIRCAFFIFVTKKEAFANLKCLKVVNSRADENQSRRQSSFLLPGPSGLAIGQRRNGHVHESL